VTPIPAIFVQQAHRVHARVEKHYSVLQPAGDSSSSSSGSPCRLTRQGLTVLVLPAQAGGRSSATSLRTIPVDQKTNPDAYPAGTRRGRFQRSNQKEQGRTHALTHPQRDLRSHPWVQHVHVLAGCCLCSAVHT
jgi:hypothetical protein